MKVDYKTLYFSLLPILLIILFFLIIPAAIIWIQVEEILKFQVESPDENMALGNAKLSEGKWMDWNNSKNISLNGQEFDGTIPLLFSAGWPTKMSIEVHSNDRETKISDIHGPELQENLSTTASAMRYEILTKKSLVSQI